MNPDRSPTFEPDPLLGHESSKTTEIYTLVTTKGFDQIVNPMDKLDL